MNQLEALGFKKSETARSVVFFATVPNVILSARHIEWLIAEAGPRNARICLHTSAANLSHDMIILEHAGNAFHAHRHPTKSETVHVIRGILRVNIFETENQIQKHDLVCGSILRIEPQIWHKNEAVSSFVVYHETKRGPFDATTDNETAPWEQKP